MGHLHRLKEEYRQLADRLDRGTVALPEPQAASAWEGWREILEILYTPEEAALAAQLPVRPTPLGELARRLHLPEQALAARLDPMCDKGLVMDLAHPKTGERRYLLSPPVTGFFEFSMMRAQDSIPKKRMAEALHAYLFGDPAFAHELFQRQTVIGRTLVQETALADDQLPDVLEWQRATELVRGARSLAVSLCYCRHTAEHVGQSCGAERENCLSLNHGADFVIRRGFGRELSSPEALEILERSRSGGLVQIADNVMSRPTFICNCCGCCCEQLRAVNTYGLAAVNPSGFVPRHDPECCNGCSRCARACPVAAIAMEPRRELAERKNALTPRIDQERCIGCGVCTEACRKRALQMARSGKTPRVPANTVEKVVRMALERNRLADLLFDEGAGLGSRFLYRIVEAIVRLPPAKALLATEQVRSRFVKGAMSRFRGTL